MIYKCNFLCFAFLLSDLFLLFASTLTMILIAQFFKTINSYSKITHKLRAQEKLKKSEN